MRLSEYEPNGLQTIDRVRMLLRRVRPACQRQREAEHISSRIYTNAAAQHRLDLTDDVLRRGIAPNLAPR